MIDRPKQSILTSNKEVDLWEANCVEQFREAYLDSLLKVASFQEVQLEIFAQAPPEKWLDYEDLKRHLRGRFAPVQWPTTTPTYQHTPFTYHR